MHEVSTQAWRVNAFDAPLTCETVGVNGASDIVVRVAHCGLNHADTLMLRGRYQETPPVPFTPGMEFTGHVVAARNSGFQNGDAVLCLAGQGGLAEYAVVRAEDCYKVPEGAALDAAAGLVIAYGTAYVALIEKACLKAGDSVFITGAAGGVGLAATRLLAGLGITAIALVSDEDKAQSARQAGASEVIIGRDPDVISALKGRVEVDCLYDAIGGAIYTQAARLVRRGGHIIPVGFAGGEIPQIAANHVLVKNQTVHGVYWGGLRALEPALTDRVITNLLEMLARGEIHVDIVDRFAFAAADQALEALRARKARGRVIVDINTA